MKLYLWYTKQVVKGQLKPSTDGDFSTSKRKVSKSKHTSLGWTLQLSGKFSPFLFFTAVKNVART